MKQTKKQRKEMLKYRINQCQGNIKYFREQLNSSKKELDFINGKKYTKSWEEGYKQENKK